MSKYCKLIMVTAANNNKFYEMSAADGASTFNVKYGRVEGGTPATGSYPISQWNSKYNEKVNKGYKDVTQFVTTTVTETTTQAPAGVDGIKDPKVREFMALMKSYTDGLVRNTYSVVATAVTQAQVDAAQKLIDELNKMNPSLANEILRINDKLTELYTVIPRSMRQVRDHLLPSINFARTMQQEQDNLDAMALQVSQVQPKKGKKAKVGKNSLLDDLGVDMKTCTPNHELQYLINQLNNSRVKLEAVFEVKKPEEDKVFEAWLAKQKNKETKILIHGTRSTSVIPILETGLKIRPSGNFSFSGKVYGEGNYYSETVQKSLNYTGGGTDKILLVYEVHTGNPFVYDGWFKGNSFTLNYKNLQERGYDSTFVKAGGGLLNTEIIAYTEQQNRIKYILWLK